MEDREFEELVDQMGKLRSRTAELEAYGEDLERRISGSLANAEKRAASWWEAAKYFARGIDFYVDRYDRACRRANAAEAKLKAAEREVESVTKMGHFLVKDYRGQRDAADTKLDQVRAAIDSMKTCHTPEQHNTQNRNVLNSIRRITHADEPITTISNPVEPVTDREEPAMEQPPTDMSWIKFGKPRGEKLSEEPAGETKPSHALSIEDVPDEHGPRGVCSCGLWVDSDQEGSVPAIASRWGKHWLHATGQSVERQADSETGQHSVEPRQDGWTILGDAQAALLSMELERDAHASYARNEAALNAKLRADILNVVRRGADWGRISEREALEDIRALVAEPGRE